MVGSIRYANGRDCPMCREGDWVATQREANGLLTWSSSGEDRWSRG